ncbi:hypothetical protein TIFTF001_039661 [Ficus carica]|uniref:Uncharacterized protein n=1 Tax=Ficus carica TaxID=3494 RepID=A0AA88EB97_FICCA|nr:hypothetical protein TIFTF001_039661 [Ficus carica]
MAELLSPMRLRQRSPMANRLQSPTSPSFFLGSNDDQLERAQARAARAAASRRRITMNADHLPPPPPPPDPFLSKEEIIALLQTCIKLASENVLSLSAS